MIEWVGKGSERWMGWDEIWRDWMKWDWVGDEMGCNVAGLDGMGLGGG
jgi:hypothetical protein